MVALKDFKTKEEPLRSLLGLLLSRNCNSNLICALGLSVTIMLLHSTSFSAYTYISGTPVRRYWHLGYLAVSSMSFCISMQSHSSGSGNTNGSETDIYKLVLNVFQEPASL
ncbi:hypothetical protein B296_00010801 [Ensete ventricosum]|uniref:Uncharacterized protein n=1 Tax=Ensete ventricosum TaxID=4639 RepID=A0A427AQJ3_ENSVE|nr:hypothetical protein B296_00010801 [Ensete ventricosum]